MMQKALHFEWQNLLLEGCTNAGMQISSGNARTGTYKAWGMCYTTSWYHLLHIPVTTAKDEFYFQTAYCYNASGNPTAETPILAWFNGSTVLGGIRVDTNGNFKAYTGNFATLVGTGTAVISKNQWFIVEVRVKLADADGVINLRIDLTSDINFSGDTKPGTETTITHFRLGQPGNAMGNQWYVDDIIINDTDNTDGLGNTSWPGGAHVSLLRPTSDGATLQWTPTPGGDHYATVDETPAAAADNLKSTTAGDIDDLNLANLDALAASVKQIKFEAFSRKASSSSPSRLAMGLDIGVGGVLWSQDLDLPTSSGHVFEYYRGDPTVSEVNDGILKLKSAA